MKPLTDQLACAKRELALRRNVYPRWVQERRKGWTPDKAKHEIDCMEAIVQTLAKAVEGEQFMLQFPKGKPPELGSTGWDKVKAAIER